MNRIKKDELYQYLKGFLKTKGIEFQEGSYTLNIQKACGLLTNTVNLSQQALERTKAGMDKRLERMRQVIHEKTAPKPPISPTPPPSPSSPLKPGGRAVAAKKPSPAKPKKAKANRSR